MVDSTTDWPRPSTSAEGTSGGTRSLFRGRRPAARKGQYLDFLVKDYTATCVPLGTGRDRVWPTQNNVANAVTIRQKTDGMRLENEWL